MMMMMMIQKLGVLRSSVPSENYEYRFKSFFK